MRIACVAGGFVARNAQLSSGEAVRAARNESSVRLRIRHRALTKPPATQAMSPTADEGCTKFFFDPQSSARPNEDKSRRV